MTRHFIIIEPDPIVCMDLEGMLTSQYPEAHVSMGVSLAKIGPAIHNCGPDSVLLVRGTLVVDDDDLRRVVHTAVTRGCQVVIIGQDQDLGFPAIAIDLPFTTEMMIAALNLETATGDMKAAE